MKKSIFLFLSLTFCWVNFNAFAQFNPSDIGKVIHTLASDSMMGRMAGTKYSDMAAGFIASELSKAGLKPLPGQSGLLQQFSISSSRTENVSGTMDGNAILKEQVVVITSQEHLNLNGNTCMSSWVSQGDNIGQKLFGNDRSKGDHVVFLDTAFRKIFSRIQKMPIESMPGEGSLVIILSSSKPGSFDLKVESSLLKKNLMNVGGMIPGKRKDEYVLFSGHYDHIGIGKPVEGDSIFNGANDDASGTTAVITLAKYFASQKEIPERTLLFAAFTAEESGGFGSRFFSNQLNPDKVVAMFNIEMIGTESKWGKNSAYITGFEKSDFGSLLQENLKGSTFYFYPDPYPDQNLFYRSDNATLAKLGVPAHTISTSKMDSEKYYHTVNDEVETLDLNNMAEIIRAISVSSTGIISGKQTPKRVSKE